MEIAELVNLEKKDRKAYDESLKNYRDLKNALDSSEAKGIAKGIENTIINFYKAGAPLEMISQATGMEVEAVKKLLKEAGVLDL